MFTLQPEEIQYVMSSVSPEKIAPDEDDELEGVHENRVEITLENGTRFIYQNLPFTLSKNNRQITAIDIRVGDMIDSMRGTEKGNKYHDVVLHYYMINKESIPELGTRIDVEIESPIEVNFGSIEHHTTPYKTHSLKGNFAVKEIQYESTIMSGEITYYDAKITLTKVFGLDEEGEVIPEEEDYEEMLLTLLNPINANIQVHVFLNQNMIFDGKLVDISTSSLRAMGKEVELTEKIIKRSFHPGQPFLILSGGSLKWEYIRTIEDILDIITRNHERVPQVRDYNVVYNTTEYVDFHKGYFDSVSFIGNSVWDVLVQVANTYNYFLTVEQGTPSVIYLKTEEKHPINGNLQYTAQIPSHLIEDRDITFRAVKGYTGVELTGDLSPLNSGWSTRDYLVKCYNKALIAGEGTDFSDNSTIETDEAITDSTSFHGIAAFGNQEPPNGTSITFSDGKIQYIESTIVPPEGFEVDDYASTFTISARPEIMPCVRNQEENSEEIIDTWRWQQGTIRIKSYAPETANVAFVIKPQHGQNMNPGHIYIDIFGEYDDLEYVEIEFPLKTPNAHSLLEGYFIYELSPHHHVPTDGTENLFAQNASLMPGTSEQRIQMFCKYVGEKENAKLQNIKLTLNNYFNAKPSDILQYEYKESTIEDIVVENYQFSFDKKREISTSIEGYSYVWPI